MSPEIVLYRQDGACSFVPHALLLHLGIPFTSVILKFENGKMSAADNSFTNAEYKRINPTGYVPAFKVDNEIITEVPAILSYICNLQPEKELLGATPVQQARAYEWMTWLSGTLHGQGYGALWAPNRFTDDDAENIHKAITDMGSKKIMECYERIENRLDGAHAVGDRFTAIDLNLHTFWRWGALRIGRSKNEMADRFPRFTALAEEVEKLHGVRKALEDEHLELGFPIV